MRCFPGVLQLIEELVSEVASENFCAIRGAPEGNHLDNKLLLRADEQDVLLYIEDAAAQTRGQKEKATFNDRVIHLYTAILLQKLGNMHSTACGKRPLRFDAFLLKGIPQTKPFSTPVK